MVEELVLNDRHQVFLGSDANFFFKFCNLSSPILYTIFGISEKQFFMALNLYDFEWVNIIDLAS